MKIAIFGSRDIDTKKAYNILFKKMTTDNEYITSGNIKGVANEAIKVSKEKGIKITLYNYESNLGYYTALKDIFIKNKKMINSSEQAIVIWNAKSKGTKREIDMLKKANKHFELDIIEPNKTLTFYDKKLNGFTNIKYIRK